jgi:hypothetical protein
MPPTLPSWHPSWVPGVGYGCQGEGAMARHNSCAIMDKHRRIYYGDISILFDSRSQNLTVLRLVMLRYYRL